MSIPLPIPSGFTTSYFYLPYRIQDKIFKSEMRITSNTTFMDLKAYIATQAREFYKKPVTPYDFIIGRVETSDFSLYQLYRDDINVNTLDISYASNFIFAYEVPRYVLNEELIPALSSKELIETLVKSPSDD